MSIEAMKLTDPHDHPEPHTMKWTQTEMDYINKRVETAVRQAIEQAEKQSIKSIGLETLEKFYSHGFDRVTCEKAIIAIKESLPQKTPVAFICQRNVYMADDVDEYCTATHIPLYTKEQL